VGEKIGEMSPTKIHESDRESRKEGSVLGGRNSDQMFKFCGLVKEFRGMGKIQKRNHGPK